MDLFQTYSGLRLMDDLENFSLLHEACFDWIKEVLICLCSHKETSFPYNILVLRYHKLTPRLISLILPKIFRTSWPVFGFSSRLDLFLFCYSQEQVNLIVKYLFNMILKLVIVIITKSNEKGKIFHSGKSLKSVKPKSTK